MVDVAKENIGNANFSLPPAIQAEFRRLGDSFGEKNKMRWVIASAAVLKLLETPEAERSELIQRLMGARHFPEQMQRLVEEAKATGAKRSRPIRGAPSILPPGQALPPRRTPARKQQPEHQPNGPEAGQGRSK